MTSIAYRTRSQAAEAGKRKGFANFRTEPHLREAWNWRVIQMSGPTEGPEATEWAKGKDYVAWLETSFRDGGRMPGYDCVLIITCLLEEVPADDKAHIDAQGWRVEPITPSLFEPQKRSESDLKSTGGKAPGAERAKSEVESPVKIVWATADEMPGADRAAVIAACVEKGVNASTASTQYYKWKKAQGT